MIEQHETPSTDATGEGYVVERDLSVVVALRLACLTGIVVLAKIVATGYFVFVTR